MTAAVYKCLGHKRLYDQLLMLRIIAILSYIKEYNLRRWPDLSHSYHIKRFYTKIFMQSQK